VGIALRQRARQRDPGIRPDTRRFHRARIDVGYGSTPAAAARSLQRTKPRPPSPCWSRILRPDHARRYRADLLPHRPLRAGQACSMGRSSVTALTALRPPSARPSFRCVERCSVANAGTTVTVPGSWRATLAWSSRCRGRRSYRPLIRRPHEQSADRDAAGRDAGGRAFANGCPVSHARHRPLLPRTLAPSADLGSCVSSVRRAGGLTPHRRRADGRHPPWASKTYLGGMLECLAAAAYRPSHRWRTPACTPR